MNSFADVIAAVSTPPGKGGVAIIRISGAGALALTEKMFCPMSGMTLSDYPSRMQVYGFIKDRRGKKIDDGMATYFEEGRSFTGEETVEISSHGGTLVTSMVLECALGLGARLAEAGEFTRRAFVNGKITLTEAESIGALLEAESREQVALFSPDSKKKLSESFGKISDGLTALLSEIYARIDYPDEDLGTLSDGEIEGKLSEIKEGLHALLCSYSTGHAIKDGIKTVIVGKPNAGKSSLYNAILGEDAAIVTDISGTTTDVLERVAVMGRVKLRLCDTAGLRDGSEVGVIEKIGIERTRAALSDAELILAVFDTSLPLDSYDAGVIDMLTDKRSITVAVLNKLDVRSDSFDEEKIREIFDTVVSFNAKSPQPHLETLTKTVNALFTDERIVCGETAVIFGARQRAAVETAADLVESAISGIRRGECADMFSSQIERALRAVSEADGREVSDAVTREIFSRFCVGK